MSLKKIKTISLDEGLQSFWATLSPVYSSKVLPIYNLSAAVVTVGRNPDCVVKIEDKRLSGKHCTLTYDKDNKAVFLTDESTNGTFIGTNKVGKARTEQIQNGQQIWLLPASRVPVTETIGFKIHFLFNKKQQHDKMEKQAKEAADKAKKEEKEKQKEKAKNEKDKAINIQLAQSIKDQITCSFCFQIMCVPVSIQPCNHRFCGGCLAELFEKKKDTCIQCRKQITTAVRDAAFTSIICDYLKSHPEEKRDDKDQEQSKKKNIFGFDPLNVRVLIYGKSAVVVEKKKAVGRAPVAVRGRRAALVRASSDLSASDDEADKCRECINERNGFKCTSAQLHVGCHNCGKLIAQRDDPRLHQSCLLCTTHFCNLYYPPCIKSGNRLCLLKERRDKCQIDAALIRGNTFEFQSIRNYLLSKKLSSEDVFDYLLKVIEKGNFSYIIDKKIMKVPPLVPKEVKIQKDSAICDICWNDLWFQMVFAYFQQIYSELPSSVRDRPVCYWGVNCKTMGHNYEHAKKLKHLVLQTRY